MRIGSPLALLTGLALGLATAARAAETAIEASPIDQRIAAFIAEHPQAKLDEVAVFANAELAKHGLTYRFDDFDASRNSCRRTSSSSTACPAPDLGVMFVKCS